MRIEKVGEGEPEITVVGSLHGDEPCGKKAIERFLSRDFEIKKPVKFIIGNEKALERDRRYIDTDVNRAFPGDPDSDQHDERLAASIMEEIEGSKVLDIHSTRSSREPFATFHDSSEQTLEVIRSLDLDYAVHFPEGNGTLKSQVKSGVVLESGLQGSEEAAENAYRKLVNFLASEDVLERDFQTSEPEFFEFSETVEGKKWEFMAENFSHVEKGEIYAEKPEGEKLRAEENFYPVLMSTNGYSQILGHKARKIEPEEI